MHIIVLHRRPCIQVLSVKRKPDAMHWNLRLRMRSGAWDKKLVQIWAVENQRIAWPPPDSFSSPSVAILGTLSSSPSSSTAKSFRPSGVELPRLSVATARRRRPASSALRQTVFGIPALGKTSTLSAGGAKTAAKSSAMTMPIRIPFCTRTGIPLSCNRRSACSVPYPTCITKGSGSTITETFSGPRPTETPISASATQSYIPGQA